MLKCVGIPNCHVPELPLGPQITPTQATGWLYTMATRVNRDLATDGISIIVNAIFAVLKEGVMSKEFLGEIIRTVADSLNVQNFDVDAGGLMRHQLYRLSIDDTNIDRVIANWSPLLLPDETLRLKHTIEQASGSGLTCLIVIGRAFKYYKDFNWTRINELIPTDIANARAAMFLVGNNPWRGFRSELGLVKRRMYKNLSYVCKELLIKGRGENGLRRYAGWLNSPVDKLILDTMIDDYSRVRLEGGEQPVAQTLTEDLHMHVQMLIKMADQYDRVYI